MSVLLWIGCLSRVIISVIFAVEFIIVVDFDLERLNVVRHLIFYGGA